MAAASSLRGLSSVTMATSAARGDDVAHQRALATIAIAAAPEDDNQAFFCQRPQSREHFLQRVGLMRVIDENRRAITLTDEFEPPRRALERFERRKDLPRVIAARDGQPRGDERVRDLEGAGKRQIDLIVGAIMAEPQRRR